MFASEVFKCLAYVFSRDVVNSFIILSILSSVFFHSVKLWIACGFILCFDKPGRRIVCLNVGH